MKLKGWACLYKYERLCENEAKRIEGSVLRLGFGDILFCREKITSKNGCILQCCNFIKNALQHMKLKGWACLYKYERLCENEGKRIEGSVLRLGFGDILFCREKITSKMVCILQCCNFVKNALQHMKLEGLGVFISSMRGSVKTKGNESEGSVLRLGFGDILFCREKITAKMVASYNAVTLSKPLCNT
jgi:hypothetical protein